jgi:chromosome segregation ATPase
MSGPPHTLDHLCRQEKEKVFEMLKQLNEFKKRCASLEEQLGSRELECERLSGREELMSRQLEATQAKLFEAIESSKDSQIQIEELSLKLQKSEVERKAVNVQLRDAQIESQSLRKTIRQFRTSQDRLLSTSAQCEVMSSDKETNTDSSTFNFHSVGVQAPSDSCPSPIRLPRPPPNHGPDDTGIQSAALIEPDEELEQLISILNRF